jgi:RimJ/RimL family protein N-acetyltransferase
MSTRDLDTERLTLRLHRLDDFDEYKAMWADPVVTRHIGGTPSTEEMSWTKLLRSAGMWSTIGIGYWVIREKGSGRFVGEAGLADFKRAIDPPFAGTPEVGWALASWAHGKGFATEAVRAVLGWADANLDARRTVCVIDVDNLASIRVADKCGFKETARTTYKESAVILFERPAESAERARNPRTAG